jgi:hypothetical protein
MEELRMRLIKLHQEKLEPTLIERKDQISLTQQELEDLCEFLNIFLYD